MNAKEMAMASIGKEDAPIIVVPDEIDAPITSPQREPATTGT